ncbi:NADPH2:quinone reductase [Ekhidna lutea]|uniref:NADPH2:quinone reductase n=1 Tax=Ekhidna lutea TaxID=447679 RepID=A0A239HR84_EKHLU|nr:zinc-binding dehydrogenase [Ekhidna lutea]SNS83711.1 NADPH2:quinone reductase [Ekhidna lutea]
MKVYQLRRTGKPKILKIEEINEPTAAAGEVKVKVEAIGINYAEILSRKGQYSWAPKKPYVMGMECYGEVTQVGEGVSSFKVGDKVIVGQQHGSYAEYTCAPEHLCFPAFDGFTPEENAAYLVNFMTAWVGLKKMCRVERGERVLIQAAAGGVGTAAVQIASALGCEVYGTASKDDKLKLIESLGGKPINYREKDFYQEIIADGGQVDCVLETVGGEVFKKSMKLLAPFGRLVVIGFASMNLKIWNPFSWIKTYRDAPKVNMMKMATESKGVFASHIGYLTANKELTSDIWEELFLFTKDHDLRPVVGRIFDFSELPEAHAFMESRQSTGKLVVKL